MNNKFLPSSMPRTLRALLSSILLLLTAWTASATGGLQGQNKGDTNDWFSVNLQGWVELDYIPFRVYFGSGSVGTQTVTISFQHLSGTTPGFEDLTSFTCFTTNITFTSGPTLTTDPSGTWTYTFTVNITDNNPAEVRFFARLAAGAHLNGGSSLHLNSSVGLVQIHKPGPGPGAPDLAIVKTGPATAPQGGIITYTLSYTNQAVTNTAIGTQISDILPPGVTVDPNSLPANAHLVGNTIFWDLTNVVSGASGQVTFQAQVQLTTPVGTVLTNFSQILSSQNDANMADNTSIWLTTVISGCTTPTVTSNPESTTNCPGDPVVFSVAASGTAPLQYQWRLNGTNILGATTNTYIIPSVSAADAGSYDVVVSNGCGSTNSAAATLVVNTEVSASGPIDQTVCPGGTVIFSTTAAGTGPFTYAWLKNNQPLSVTGGTLTLTNVSANDTALYSVIVSGACGSVTNSATLTINLPPTVTIFSPTNGTVFIAPATFTVWADAQDPDGDGVTKVEFFASTNGVNFNKIGEATNVVYYSTNFAAYAVGLTNVPTGTDTFVAVATDFYGATGTSAPVSVVILPQPPLTILSAIHFDPQTGLYEETVRVSNPTTDSSDAVRVYVYGLTNGITVYNASGTTNGVPYVQSSAAVPSGGYVDFTIEYYVTIGGAVPNPTLVAALVPPVQGGSGAVVGTGVRINRGLMLPDKTFLVEFATVSNLTYYVEYSSDLQNWQTAQPAITGNGTWIQWIDNGQPKTVSAPSVTAARFYRVVVLP